jgi:hypothetical protein
MAVVNKATLQSQADQIANETSLRANTALRVGTALRNIVDSVSLSFDAGTYGVSTTNTGAANVAALRLALAAVSAAGGGLLRFGAGTFPFALAAADFISWPDGVYLSGAGMRATVLDFSGNADYSYDNGIFLMQGTGRSNAQSVTTTVARGATSAIVTDASGFASGDIVQIRSTETYVVSDGGTRAE